MKVKFNNKLKRQICRNAWWFKSYVFNQSFLPFPKEDPSFEQTIKSAAKPSKRLFPINGRPTKIGNKPSGKAILVHRRTRERDVGMNNPLVSTATCSHVPGTCRDNWCPARTSRHVLRWICTTLYVGGEHARVASQGEGLLRERWLLLFLCLRTKDGVRQTERASLQSHDESSLYWNDQAARLFELQAIAI